MDLLERNIEKWKQSYFYNEKMRVNRSMAFGRNVAEGLENGEVTGDIAFDLLMDRMPKFEIMDKPVMAELKSGNKIIPLLAKPDTMKPDMTAFKEYKTGQDKWTKRKVDDSGQITFYATVLFLKSGKIPHDIELVQILTEKEDNEALDSKLRATGDIYRHPTRRTMSQVLNMMVRMKKAWLLIEKLTEEELL